MYTQILFPLCLLAIQSPNEELDPSICGINLTSSRRAVIQKLGQPKRVFRTNDPNPLVGSGNYSIWEYKGLKLTFEINDNKSLSLVTIEVFSPSIPLDNGITVGMLESDIIKRLGQTNSKYISYNTKELWYHCKTKGDYNELIFTIDLSTNKVISYRLDENID